mmetsp:Transcript_6236/g.10401  ORF Transcript_6236/g.10401 Transcript_6236/m.10401 type:complete len:486 (-) Transcript_6236:67-1524(-)
MEDPVLILLSIQFLFDWVVSTIVAVTWCYLFKLAAPQYSNDLVGWGLYTLLMILVMPFVRMLLLRQLQKEDDSQSHDLEEKRQDDKIHKKALQGWRLLLSATCGSAVGTALTGLIPLLWPRWSNLDMNGPVSFTFAVVVTALYVVWQARLERRLHVGSLAPDGYLATLFGIMLMSTWSTLGFFWNIVWSHALQHLYTWYTAPAPTTIQSQLLNPMQTFMDMLYGRPQTMTRTMQDLCLKAAVTLVMAIIVLVILPDPPPLGESSTIVTHEKRRGLLGAQMVLLTLAAYAVTDVGFYFGTLYVAKLVSSEMIGLAVAFAYAVLMTCLIIAAGMHFRFQFKSNLGKWLFQLGCFLVSYAWWYSYQELLFHIQGFWLDQLNCSDSVTTALRVTIAIIFTGLLTLAFSWGTLDVMQYRISRIKADRSKDELSTLLGSETLSSNSLRFLAACSGLLVASQASDTPKEGVSEWHGVGYGAFDEAQPTAMVD